MNTREACRLARGVRCECRQCFYCDDFLSHRHEHDHFPVPKVAGGNDVVSACLDCHDLKDRYTIVRWPLEATIIAIRGLYEEALTSTRGDVSLDKLEEWTSSQDSLSDESILARWRDLPPLSRIMYAKMRSVEEESRRRKGKDGLPFESVSTFSSIAARAQTLFTQRQD